MDRPLVNIGAASLLPPLNQPLKQPLLPRLREELRLLPAAGNADGTPAWVVQDPINNRFFRIGWLDFELLLRWANATAKSVAEAVTAETTLDVDEADVQALVMFLDQHSLLRVDSQQAVERLNLRAKALKKSPAEWLLHNYLFFRVPLVRPQEWLAAAMPFLSWVFSRTTALIVLCMSLAGIFLAARQWDTFAATAVDHLTWSGIWGYVIALALTKTLHEIGHAVTATRYGVRVAHMGVALLVMFPMLYTDTSESWKLSNPRQRLAIASAGIITELAIAGLSTLAWSLAPDGGVRNALFFLATTSWVLTLLINVSPFMRFDGYFILTDLLDFPNLHERSGAMARTWLRRTLLGFTDPWPERTAGRGNTWLTAFALVTWLYRLSVFLGIALLVYYFFFKVLGIFLMAVELIWFIGLPIWNEVKVWIDRRADIKMNRLLIAGLLILVALGAMLVPWQTRVHGFGWLHAERHYLVYSPLAGKLSKLPVEGPVAQGQVLFGLESPDLLVSEQRATGLADARGQELLGLSGLQDGEERRGLLKSQQDKFLAEASLFSGELSRLQLSAPFAGRLVDLDPQLTAGVWVQPRQLLASVVDPSKWVVEVFVPESDVARVRVGDKAQAYLGIRSQTVLQGRVLEVDTTRTLSLPHSMLDATAGGPIATIRPTADDKRPERGPKDAIYRVKIALDDPQPVLQMMLTNVVISGEPRAWLPEIVTRILAVGIRESGF